MRKIVFLHNERSAGSALRRYFNRTIGFSNIAWWGINLAHQDDPLVAETIQSKILCGGHAPLTAYREYGLDLDKSILMSILRDPVERVISLYEFDCATNPPLTGTSTSSPEQLLALIQSSGPYRQRAFSSQCAYVSESESAEQALDIIYSGNYLIGTQSNIEPYVGELSRVFQLDKAGVARENANSRESYLDEYFLQSRLIEVISDCCAQDVSLYEIISSGEGGYINTISKTVEEFFLAEIERVAGDKLLYPSIWIKELKNKARGKHELVLGIRNGTVSPISIVPINGPPGFCVRLRARKKVDNANEFSVPIWLYTSSSACELRSGEEKEIVFEVDVPETIYGEVFLEAILGHSGDEIFEFEECTDSTTFHVSYSLIRLLGSQLRNWLESRS